MVGDFQFLSFEMDNYHEGGGDLIAPPATSMISNTENTLLIDDVAREEI